MIKVHTRDISAIKMVKHLPEERQKFSGTYKCALLTYGSPPVTKPCIIVMDGGPRKYFVD